MIATQFTKDLPVSSSTIATTEKQMVLVVFCSIEGKEEGLAESSLMTSMIEMQRRSLRSQQVLRCSSLPPGFLQY